MPTQSLAPLVLALLALPRLALGLDRRDRLRLDAEQALQPAHETGRLRCHHRLRGRLAVVLRTRTALLARLLFACRLCFARLLLARCLFTRRGRLGFRLDVAHGGDLTLGRIAGNCVEHDFRRRRLHAFDQLEAGDILVTLSADPGSARVLTNCGFVYLGDAETFSVARNARVPTWTYIRKM